MRAAMATVPWRDADKSELKPEEAQQLMFVAQLRMTSG
jgi:hypothetical protein